MNDLMLLAGWIGAGIAGLVFIVWKFSRDLSDLSYSDMLLIFSFGGFFGPMVFLPILIYYVNKIMDSDLLSRKPFKRLPPSAPPDQQ
jgi:hypothetical protein